MSGDDHAEQHCEHHDRRGVIQKRLALDQAGQPRRSADVAEYGDHRGRVRGRDDRAEQQADHQRHARDRPERETDDGGADNRGDDGEHENRGGVLEDPPHVGSDRALEDKQR